MQFTSFSFWVFFAIVFAVHAVLKHKYQNHLLLIASYIFYGSWDWRFIPLLLGVTSISYVSALKIENSADKNVKRLYLRTAVITEILLLVFFKYFGFLSANTFKILLPLGISYFIFQAISYTVDVYRGKIAACREFHVFALFKSFFPILYSGPIERAGHLIPQLQNRRRLTVENLRVGTYLILWGLFKKLYIADHIAPQVDASFAGFQNLTALETWLAVYGFTFQIYCDFSGYTDIARGVAEFFGIHLSANFDLPYWTDNPVDFWRRWHMSLSSWFRDYVLEPLYFKWKNIYAALFITFFLVGLWHGASWNFVLAGLSNGSILCAYVFLKDKIKGRVVPPWFGVVLMFHVTCLNFVFFRAQTLVQIRGVFSHLLTGSYLPSSLAGRQLLVLVFFTAPLIAMECLQVKRADLWAFLRLSKPLQFALVLLAVALFSLVSLFVHPFASQAQEFIYYQF